MMNDKKSYDERRKVALILNALFAGSLPKRLEDDIRVWFAEDDLREIKDRELEGMFVKTVNEKISPSESTYDSLRKMKQKLGLPVVEYDTDRVVKAVGKKVALRGRRLAVRIAAVIIPMIIATSLVALWPRHQAGDNIAATGEAAWVTHQTQDGQSDIVALADGSQVTVYAGGKISYPEAFGDVRAIKLSGRAFFTVTRDESTPFVVQANGMTVTVLGTEFAITAPKDGNIATVALYSGSVNVDAGGHSAVLKPGETCEYNRSLKAIKITKADPEERDKQDLDFNLATLAEMFASVEEKYNLTIDINAKLPDTRYSIRFDSSEDIEVVLETISRLAGNFSYTIEGDRIYIITN